MHIRRIAALTAIAATALTAATRIKDLANIEGVRDNQLIGYGIVVGLNGTGDKQLTVFSAQSLTNLLSRMGVRVSPTAIMVRNTAAVLVTATLPPFAQPGSRLDVTVGAAGDATNLQGGLLIMTPLRGADSQVYAVAQGSVVTGGFVAGGRGNTQTVNHPTAGRVPEGAIIERPAPSVEPGSRIRLQLRSADFATAARIARAIQERFGDGRIAIAHAENSALISVNVPPAYQARAVDFIAELQALPIEADRPARVVVNERTGTVVIGGEVVISPVTILHGALTVDIQTTPAVTIPGPTPKDKAQVILPSQTNVAAKSEPARNVSLKPGASVDNLVQALVATGSTPRDIIAVLQALKAAGAIDAELEII